MTQTQPFEQISGHGTRLLVRMAEPSPQQQPSPPVVTMTVLFEHVRHLLCGKPLRRPNRSRPLA